MLSEHIANGAVGNGFYRANTADISVSDLIDGIIRAAAILGPEKAARTLAHWTRDELVQYRWCALLSGLTLDQGLGLGDDIRFQSLPRSSNIAFTELPVQAQTILAPREVVGDLVKVTIACHSGPALRRPHQPSDAELRRQLARMAFPGSYPDYPEPSRQPLVLPTALSSGADLPDDFVVRLCKALSLVTNHYVTWTMEWVECPEETPFGLCLLGGRSFHGTQGRSAARQPPARLSREHLEKALWIVQRSRLTNEEQLHRRLEVAMDRWVKSKEPSEPSDQLIDLRIALEAVFLKRYKPGVEKRIAKRGAWYLGSSPEDRDEIARQFRAAYSEGSSVVHAKPAGDTRKVGTTLQRAQDLCRTAILKMMEDSEEPDWAEIVTGARNDM